jgi:O-antigen/teichoic acid export membrane protein
MLKNGIYITLSGALRALMGIATIPLLIKILGVEEYGLWALIYSTVALVFTIEGGIAIAATFFIARDLDDSKELAITLTVIAAVTAALAGGAAVLTYSGANIIVKFFSALSTLQADQARQAIQIGAWAISARLFQQVPISLQQTTHRYDSLSLLNLLLAALTTLSLVPIAALPPAMVAAFGGRLVAMMAWFAASNVLVLLLHLAIISPWLSSRSLRPQWQTARMIEFLRYCFFTWLSSIGSLLFMRGDRLIVGKILDIKTLGVYAAITDITVQINNLSAFPLQPLLPAISNMWQVPHNTTDGTAPEKNRQAIRQVVRQGTQTNALVAFSLGAILFYLASQLFLLITSRPPSIEELLCFRIAIVGYTIYSLNAVGYFALFAIGGARTCGLIQLGSGIFALCCIFMGVTYGGLVGAAIGNLSYSVTLLLVVMSMRQMEIPLTTWLKWLKLPLIWFSIAVALGILLEGHLVWQYLFLAIQLVILAAWFVMARPVKLHRWR